MRRLFKRRPGKIPGFPLTMGITVTYLGLIVLIPLAGLVLKTANLSWSQFWATITDDRVTASLRLSIGASLAAATINLFFGFMAAWVLVRYPFPGRKIVDALVDLPFAMPTAVSGIALTALYARNGWLGGPLSHVGIDGAFSRFGIVIALTFIGLPFVVRTLQPALSDLDAEIEEAAASLGAGRLQTVGRVVVPAVLPALLAGFAMAFARAVGEYGSVVFISGNMPMKTEITPLLIVTKLEQYDVAGATSIALTLLGFSFTMLLVVNGIQVWNTARTRA
ncbi:MAG: sulfate ABC transporter permease subunit CysT [Leptolyngbya sp. PLA3]|nr:MAG: sulfate ABC transporter permease subunit CysT [Cyanobacteria bacterium CYA]MCE7968288.1 sulfate ABC transporter permease subunit CysT [Leptolyngbya sp. PL-A3]